MFHPLIVLLAGRPGRWLKNGLLGLSTALLFVFNAPAAVDRVAPITPMVTAESEAFEIVGRLYGEGLVLHVDRAPDNAPVLGATLQVEFDGRSASAEFRAERGDYLIADAGWLAPLRAAGEHGLAFTLLAGEESDLLSGELSVPVELGVDPDGWAPVWWPLLLAGLLGVGIVVWRRRRRAGGAA